MNVNELLAALLVLERRVPDRHVTVDMAMAASWMADVGGHHVAAAMRAAETWPGERFPSAIEFLRAVQQAARDMAAEAMAERARGELATYACPNACVSGWIETAGNVVKPCERCRPVEYAVAKHRAAPGHDEAHCSECIAIKRGKPPAWVEDAKTGAPAMF